MLDQKLGLNNSNILTIDFLNTIFILTVLYLHHTMYTIYNIILLPEYNLNIYLQKMAVGGFLFLSGFKLTCSKIEYPAKLFIINRFFKIYLPYLIAIICYSFFVFPYINKGQLPDYKNVIIHVLGIQSIFPNFFGSSFITLWFVSILFICYIYFLLTRNIINRTILFLITQIFTISVIYIIQKYSNFIIGFEFFSKDVIIYLSYFAAGMLYAKNYKLNKISSILLISISALFFFIALYFNTYKNELFNKEFFFNFSCIISNILFYILIFKHFKNLPLSHQISSLIINISFASFFVFLFHRPIWSIMNFVWFEVSLLHSFYIIIFAPIIIFIGCHKFQSFYNRTILRYN